MQANQCKTQAPCSCFERQHASARVSNNQCCFTQVKCTMNHRYCSTTLLVRKCSLTFNRHETQTPAGKSPPKQIATRLGPVATGQKSQSPRQEHFAVQHRNGAVTHNGPNSWLQAFSRENKTLQNACSCIRQH